MGERYPGVYDPASMSAAASQNAPVGGPDGGAVGAPATTEPGPCPLCGDPLYGWIALPPVGGEASIGLPLTDAHERVIDRCETCGVALEREREIDLADEWEAVCHAGEPGAREISIPNRASLQAWIGEVGWAAIESSPGRLLHTPASLELLAERNDHTLERRRSPISRLAQAWMWQTLLNGLTFHPNFAREVRAGRLRAGSGKGGFRFAADLVVTVLGAPLVLLASAPLELGAALARRGGVLAATARRTGD